jgi:hypothetical protein
MAFKNFSEIISETKNNKDFALEYLSYLYKKDEDDIKIYCERPLSAIKCYIPLPDKMDISSVFYSNNNKITNHNNMYQFSGMPGNRIMFANSSVPFSFNNNIPFDVPIPFSFPNIILQENNLQKTLEIISSNVFYYEVTIDNMVNLNNMWPSQCVSVGFAYKNTNINAHVGWFNNSIGFHSDDGTIRFNSEKEAPVISRPWVVGDTVGAGLIYIDKSLVHSATSLENITEKSETFLVQPFFTFNGNIIYMFENPIKMHLPYYPAIGYDHPNSIKVNLSNYKFVFDIKKFIYEHTNKVISTNNSYIENIKPTIKSYSLYNENDMKIMVHHNHKSYIKSYYFTIASDLSGSIIDNVLLSDQYSFSNGPLENAVTDIIYDNNHNGLSGSTSGNYYHSSGIIQPNIEIGSSSNNYYNGPTGPSGHTYNNYNNLPPHFNFPSSSFFKN